ncbi:tRNA lysidine(34) synthetase TilS [soil metagenome]
MPLLKQFTENINAYDLFHKNDQLLLAVSGGVDSVVLCDLCSKAGYSFSIAHCNFNLRGAESDRDEQFVKALAEKYGVPLFTKSFQTENFAVENKLSIQVAARQLRYAWFEEVVKTELSLNAGSNRSYILMAHHADDNVETLLMNFFKGTGINGLTGISAKNKNIRRALLFADKKQLIDYADENKLSFVEDSSNESEKYTRNFFRNNLLPAIKKVFPQAEANLKKNIDRFAETEMLYTQSVEQHKKKLIEVKGAELHIPVLKLLKVSPISTILHEIIKDFGFTPNQTPEVIKLLNSESGKYIDSATHRILKNRKWLIIAPKGSSQVQTIIVEENDDKVKFNHHTITLTRTPLTEKLSYSSSAEIASADADKVEFPLLLRRWKTGDYFYPLGMQKKKKLSKFFIDQKLSLTQKQDVWVIESDKKIIWVVGLRIDDRFKITPLTKNVMTFSLA